MGLLSLFFLALLPRSASAGDNPWNESWRNVPQLVRILQTVPDGRAVLDAAAAKDPDFATKVKLGAASYTESTFSRTFSLIDGKEKITLHHDVTLNRDLSLSDAVVDLAHELVHFTEKGMLDPYKPGFALREFIRNGIEGQGGELSALAVECAVAWELEEKYDHFPQHRLCERYRKSGNAFNQAAARLDYYALGRWYTKTEADLKPILPEISDHATVFTSSYASKPYPVALAEEFRATRAAACANNRRKYRLIAAQSANGRQPASTASLRAERVRLRDYDQRYCRRVDEDSEPAVSVGAVDDNGS